MHETIEVILLGPQELDFWNKTKLIVTSIIRLAKESKYSSLLQWYIIYRTVGNINFILALVTLIITCQLSWYWWVIVDYNYPPWNWKRLNWIEIKATYKRSKDSILYWKIHNIKYQNLAYYIWSARESKYKSEIILFKILINSDA